MKEKHIKGKGSTYIFILAVVTLSPESNNAKYCPPPIYIKCPIASNCGVYGLYI